MSLQVEVRGQGAPLVLLHGWGMHGGMWGQAAAQLEAHFRMHYVDLPGHGASAAAQPFTLAALAELLAQRFGVPVNVCGWSLGGMIAQQWAVSRPEQVSRLVLVGSTPCFRMRDDWQYGMATEMLAQFATELMQNHAATLRRFLALQVRGSDDEKALLSQLRAQLLARGEPDLQVLQGGLEILRDADLRVRLPEIVQPTLIIAGERDKLTPPAASRYMADQMPASKLVEVAGAAHAPFLSHPEIFVEHVKRFLHE
jgi:pimeloyl-[acyl-carrier protein] methyl ester esterase